MPLENTKHLMHRLIFDSVIAQLEQQNFAVMENFFTLEQVAAWHQDALELYQQQLFIPARVGRGDNLARNTAIRGDTMRWLEFEAANQVQRNYFAFLEQLRLALNQHFMLGLFAAECHYTHYQADSFYAKHIDRHQHSRERIVSVISYLNDQWCDADGGQLRLYLPHDEMLEVKPKAGTMVCFFSEAIPHEVLVARRERVSLTAWLRIRAEAVV
jgi:SM-20-related protein